MRKKLLSLIGGAALALTMILPAGTAQAAGGPPPGTGGGEETTLGNNLSVPTIFVPSSTDAAAPVLRVPCANSPQAPTGSRESGYWEAASDGGVFTFGSAGFYGSMGGIPLAKPVVGLTVTSSRHGYWLVASDGGVFTFGDAGFYGSMGGKALNAPVVGLAADPVTGGYWLVAADGGVFSFNAPFFGSLGGVTLNKPIVGISASPTGNGYTLVASDGGVFTFGDAPFLGSLGGVKLNRPIVGMTSTPSGNGYTLVASDGGVFTFGDAPFYGSLGGVALNKPIVGMAGSVTGAGYTLVASDGGVFTFGDSVFYGSMASTTLNAPVGSIGESGSYWVQNTDATWSAYCTDAASADATAQWGSNLVDSSALKTGHPIRVEVSLLDTAAVGEPYVGYNMINLTPNLPDRDASFGTDGTSYQSGVNGGAAPHIWGPGATLKISGNGVNETVDMTAEINAGGAVVYGLNWGGTNSGTTAPVAGTYTLTFTSPANVTIIGVIAGSLVTPDYTSTTTSVEVTVS